MSKCGRVSLLVVAKSRFCDSSQSSETPAVSTSQNTSRCGAFSSMWKSRMRPFCQLDYREARWQWISKNPNCLLQTYGNAVNLLPGICATNHPTRESCTEIFSFRQSSALTDRTYYRVLRSKVLRCGTVLLDRQLKSVPIVGLLPATRAQILWILLSHYLSE